MTRSVTSEGARQRFAGSLVLPAEGYDGTPPPFPLPKPSQRELDVWDEAWQSPQAAAWAVEPWRHHGIAMWARWSVRMEAEDASASLGNVVVRLADQIGLTPAGLVENNWRIADPGESKPQVPVTGRRSRPTFTSVATGGAALEHARVRAESRRRPADPRDVLSGDC
jgi:hypothetical protein